MSNIVRVVPVTSHRLSAAQAGTAFELIKTFNDNSDTLAALTGNAAILPGDGVCTETTVHFEMISRDGLLAYISAAPVDDEVALYTVCDLTDLRMANGEF